MTTPVPSTGIGYLDKFFMTRQLRLICWD